MAGMSVSAIPGLKKAALPGTAAYGGGAGGGIAAPTVPGAKPMPNTGGSSIDPYGRMTTVQQGGQGTISPTGGYQNPTGGYGNITIERPPAPPPDFSIPARPQPTGAAPPADGGGGLTKDDIFDILGKLKPEPPPPREAAPKAPPREAAPVPVALPSAKSQGFARAKDVAGRVGSQALKALRSEMVGRGIEGSGVEGQLAGGILGDVARQTSEKAYEQERAAEEQGWEAAKLGYQGAINQRANDMGLLGTGFGGGVTQRGQDISAQPNMMALAPTILSLLGRSRY